MSEGVFARNVTKIYRERQRKGLFRSVIVDKVAVEDLTLHLPPGQITGLLGLNGAGKTTTIKMLSTLLLPTSGQIEIDGLDVLRQTNAIRKRINMIVGGERMLYWRLTGRENLWYFGQLYNVEPHILKERIQQLLALVGLQEVADTQVERYSKGMKQRLQIARGLINDPTYLFLDEPTIGLDAPIARELRLMISGLAANGKGILLTSHYLQEIEDLCSSISVMDKGRIIAQGSSTELKTLALQQRLVRVVMPILPVEVEEALQELVADTGAQLEILPDEEGITITIKHPSDLSGRIATTIVVHGGTMVRLEVVQPSLEDAILALTSLSPQKEVLHAAVS